MKIKSTLLITALAAFALATGFSAQAQTSTNAIPNPSTTAQNDFVVTAGSWLTSIDYTKAWPTNEFDLSTGAKWLNNVNWANYILVQKDINDFAFDGEMVNQGVAGTINRIQAGAGYRLLNRGDLSAHAMLDGGYDRTAKSGFLEPKAILRKLMAHGAFAEIALTYPIMLKGNQSDYPGLDIGVGVTF